MSDSLSASTAGLVLLGVAEVPQVMSAFLPSPTTAYMGGADPKRVAWLRRGEIIGGTVSLTLALGVTMVARQEAGDKAWFIFLGSAAVLGIFLWEYERAIQLGQQDAANGTLAQTAGY